MSAIIYRDWVLTIDTQTGIVVTDPDERWSTAKLNKNELMLLVGLLVQAPDDRTFATMPTGSDFAERLDALLREFHDRINADAASVFDPTAQRLLEGPNTLGAFAREAIYYGAESFYLHQFSHFARERYRQDGTWLLQNAGISIRPIIDIAGWIVRRVTNQMSATGHARKAGAEIDKGDLTNSLLVAKSDLRKRFGRKADEFIARFATPGFDANQEFSGPFTVNSVALAPLIDIGEFLYVANEYRLLESIYESPFYWMMADTSYRDTVADHRGRFLEETSAHILTKVFGRENVFVNATIPQGKKKTAGEIDVLVIYGEFVIVLQAKSKRVTLRARAGDEEALRADFQGAIQAPFDQALSCCALIENGAEVLDVNGKPIKLPSTPRLFPLVVLSDPFPAATSLSHTLLKRAEDAPAPVIWDIGVLDCAARLFPTPIEMLFYLKARGDAFQHVISDSEYNFIGYHLRAKLVLPPEYDMMMIERDFATIVDDFMIAADLGIDAPRPEGILESLDMPVMTELLRELRTAKPEIAAVVIDLYELSGAALRDLSDRIVDLRADVARNRKAIRAFSIPTGSGGLTYAVSLEVSESAKSAAAAIGRKHKYDTKSDRWYVILDSVATDQPIDAMLPLVWTWTPDPDEEDQSKVVGYAFNSRQIPVTIGGTSADDEQENR